MADDIAREAIVYFILHLYNILKLWRICDYKWIAIATERTVRWHNVGVRFNFHTVVGLKCIYIMKHCDFAMPYLQTPSSGLVIHDSFQYLHNKINKCTLHISSISGCQSPKTRWDFPGASPCAYSARDYRQTTYAPCSVCRRRAGRAAATAPAAWSRCGTTRWTCPACSALRGQTPYRHRTLTVQTSRCT